jgi:hypothetical protein
MYQMETKELLGLAQGQQFLHYQSKIKKTIEKKQDFKENYQNFIDGSFNNININEQNKMIEKLKNLEKQYKELLNVYKQTDASSSILPQLVIIRDKLTILGNDIATQMETLYNYNNKIYNKLSMNKEEFIEKIKQYRDVSLSLIEGFSNLDARDINSLLSDSDTYIMYENYNYVLWSILAITTLTLTYKLLK